MPLFRMLCCAAALIFGLGSLPAGERGFTGIQGKNIYVDGVRYSQEELLAKLFRDSMGKKEVTSGQLAFAFKAIVAFSHTVDDIGDMSPVLAAIEAHEFPEALALYKKLVTAAMGSQRDPKDTLFLATMLRVITLQEQKMAWPDAIREQDERFGFSSPGYLLLKSLESGIPMDIGRAFLAFVYAGELAAGPLPANEAAALHVKSEAAAAVQRKTLDHLIDSGSEMLSAADNRAIREKLDEGHPCCAVDLYLGRLAFRTIPGYRDFGLIEDNGATPEMIALYNELRLQGQQSIPPTKDALREAAAKIRTYADYAREQVDSGKASKRAAGQWKRDRRLLERMRGDAQVLEKDPYLVPIYEHMVNTNANFPRPPEGIAPVPKGILLALMPRIGAKPLVANIYHHNAFLYFSMGDAHFAMSLMNLGIGILETAVGDNTDQIVIMLGDLARIQMDMGEYREAEDTLAKRDSLLATISHATDDERLIDEMVAARLRSELLFRTGRNGEAGRVIAGVIGKTDLDARYIYPTSLYIYGFSAGIDQARGDYGESDRKFGKIEEKLRGGVPVEGRSIFADMAALYRSRGDPARAIEYYHKAMESSVTYNGAASAVTGNIMLELSRLYLDTGHPHEALAFNVLGLYIFSRMCGPENPSTIRAINALAEYCYITGDLASAGDLFAVAEAAAKKSGQLAVSAINAGLHSGLIALAQDNPSLAHDRLVAAAAEIERCGMARSDQHYFAMQGLANAAWRLGRGREACEAADKALAIREWRVTTIFDASSERQKLALIQDLKLRDGRMRSMLPPFDLLCHIAMGKGEDAARGLELATEWSGKVKGRYLNSLIRREKDASPEEAMRKKELSGLYLALGGSADAKNRAEIRQAISRLEREQEKEIRRAGGTVSSDEGFTARNVHMNLPDGTVLLDYFKIAASAPAPGDGLYVVFSHERGREPRLHSLGSAATVEAEIARLDSAFLRAPPAPAALPAWLGDYDARAGEFSPLGKRLVHDVTAGKKERYVVCPDAALTGFPFAALQDDGGRYLVETAEIAYISSLADVSRTGVPHNGPRRALVVGPHFGRFAKKAVPGTAGDGRLDGRRLVGYFNTALDWTMLECETVDSALSGHGYEVEYLAGNGATKANFEATLGKGWNVLHLATHGFILEDPEMAGRSLWSVNPLVRSGVLLTWGGGPLENNILTAYEVSAHDLSGVDVAVIPACESGAGSVVDGEGVMGLRMAFAQAGAGNLLTALFKIGDRQTSVFVERFYRHYLAGNAAAASLARAQREAIAARGGNEAHPVMWAAFIVNSRGESLFTR